MDKHEIYTEPTTALLITASVDCTYIRAKTRRILERAQLTDSQHGLYQGSATPGTRAKSGTPEGFAGHARWFHAQANFKLRFNKLPFECVNDFECRGFKMTFFCSSLDFGWKIGHLKT